MIRVKSFLLASVVFFATTNCKPRSYSNISSITADNPDGGGEAETCSEALSPNAPYSAKDLMTMLPSALNRAGSVFQEEGFKDFLFSWDIPKAMSGKLTAGDLGLNECALTKSINKSLDRPEYFFMLTGNGRNTAGGMTLYKGDVYAEGFYRNRMSGETSSLYPRRAYSVQELLYKQPWLEWNSNTRTLEAKIGSPSVRLLSYFSASQGANAFTLYRGTNVKYADKNTALATLNNFPFGQKYGGIFTTPDFEIAKGWAGPVVLSARVSPSEMMKAATVSSPDRDGLPAVYGGIEYGYVEIAFLYAAGDSRNLFFDNLVGKCIVGKTVQSESDKSFAPECK